MGAFSHALRREEQVKLKLKQKHVPMSWEFYGLYCTCVCVRMCLVAVRHEQLVVPMCYFCLVPVHKQSVPPNLQLAGVYVHMLDMCYFNNIL